MGLNWSEDLDMVVKMAENLIVQASPTITAIPDGDSVIVRQ